MKIEIIRETPKPPPVKEIHLNLTVAEAQQLKEALGQFLTVKEAAELRDTLGPLATSYQIYAALEAAIPANGKH